MLYGETYFVADNLEALLSAARASSRLPDFATAYLPKESTFPPESSYSLCDLARPRERM
jgi:hypothetical protein